MTPPDLVPDFVPSDHEQRARAVDPRHSIIAQAPAGSGKTTLLVNRYLRLLEVVERPEEILAITFTRKSAAEMRNRVASALAKSDEPLVQRILARSNALGWGLPEQSARLSIQTIDSFAATLVRSLPVASGHRPHMRLEERPTATYRRAVARVFARMADDDPLADDIAALVGDYDDRHERISNLLIDLLARRDQWLEPLLVGFGHGRAALHDMLNDALATLFRQVVEDVTASIDIAEQDELAVLARHAAGQLEVDWPWPHLPDQPAGWRLIATLLTTGGGQFRRRLTRREGFPPGRGTAQQMKDRANVLIDAFRKRGLDDLFAVARRLPDSKIDEAASERLQHMATVLSLAVVELNRLFEEQGLIDFTELTLAARRALGTEEVPSDLALALDYRIRHLLIDEFQDTSVAQFRLFRQLISGWQPDDGRTFFAVGDPMQSVYRFRDAEVGLFLEVVRHGIGQLRPESLRLTTNFRARPSLVDWTNRVFADAFGGIQDPVLGRISYAPAQAARPATTARMASAATASAPAVTLDVFGEHARHAEAAGLAERISLLQERNPDSSIALLVRSRTQLGVILPALKDAGIDWQGTEIDLLATTPVVVDLLSLLRALHDPDDPLHWLALLRSPCIGLTLNDLHQLTQQSTQQARPMGRLITEFDALQPLQGSQGPQESPGIPGLSADGLARLGRIQPVLKAACAGLGQVPVRRWLENTWLRLGGADAYPQRGALRAAHRLFELLEQRYSRTVDFDDLAAAVANLYADDAVSDGAHPALQIMTIHKAKGLEFDHVLLPGLDQTVSGGEPSMLLWRALGNGLLMASPGDEIYNWLRYEDRERDRNEQLRLLYVATTRARESLHLSMVGPMVGSMVGPMVARPTDAHLSDAEDVQDVQVRDVKIGAPRLNSLLGPLWEAIAPDAVAHATADTPHDRPDDIQPKPRPELCRLPRDYDWRPPIDTADVRFVDPLPSSTEVSESISGPSGPQRLAISIGVTVHEALRTLAENPLPENAQHYVELAEPGWSNRLYELGLDGADRHAAMAALRQQLLTTLADPDGRWLLSADREATSEAPFTGVIDGTLTNIIVDRTFIDDAGNRWIIDFKSSQPHADQDPDEFVTEQLRNHAAQLRRYRRVLGQMNRAPISIRSSAESPAPIRAALYFTALGRLVELEDAERTA
jgi:ATP-dependent exoDNAse (exonuclease V) beta subunit